MGLFNALDELVSGVVKTGLCATKTAVDVVSLDIESAAEDTAHTAGQALDTVVDTIDGLFK